MLAMVVPASSSARGGSSAPNSGDGSAAEKTADVVYRNLFKRK